MEVCQLLLQDGLVFGAVVKLPGRRQVRVLVFGRRLEVVPDQRVFSVDGYLADLDHRVVWVVWGRRRMGVFFLFWGCRGSAPERLLSVFFTISDIILELVFSVMLIQIVKIFRLDCHVDVFSLIVEASSLTTSSFRHRVQHFL